ncbi:MAG: MYXO-CTERM sorting domain-containing protein [Deltaproteobacteria bacterium]
MANGNRQLILGVGALAFLTAGCGATSSAEHPASAGDGGNSSFVVVANGPVSVPARTMLRPGDVAGTTAPTMRERGQTPIVGLPAQAEVARPTSAFTGPQAPISFGKAFDGIGVGLASFVPGVMPPDTTGAVGKDHYVQMVNAAYAVFNKETGALMAGPFDIKSLFKDLPDSNGIDLCKTNNNGDPSIVYDHLVDRWVLTQFAWSNTIANGFFECVAVSKTGNPTGEYWAYSFKYDTLFVDYPKVALWTDAYYVTYALYDVPGATGKFQGARICALDRTAMINGNRPVRSACLDRPKDENLLLTATLDGRTLPPSGSPAFAYGLKDVTSLNLYRLRVNWTGTGTLQLVGDPVKLTVQPFTAVCDDPAGSCVDQPNTAQTLDALAGRPMDRFAYRNFDTHESLVANHTVGASGAAGVRWYEIRNPSGTPTVYQQGTVTPDAKYRWMGSIAMDKFGNMAVGYSLGSSSLPPSIAVSGRLQADPVGTMPQGETSMLDGSGVQEGSVHAWRWGDYSSMTVDPVDECTFYYTNQYLRTTGNFNWSTKIRSFSFPGCVQAADFTISATPVTMSLGQGGSSQSVIATTKVGPASNVTLAATISPSGAGITATLDKTFVAAGDTAVLTVTTSATATAGSYSVTVTGTGPDGAPVHTAAVTLTVSSPPAPTPAKSGGCSSTGSAAGSVLPLLAFILVWRRRRTGAGTGSARP